MIMVATAEGAQPGDGVGWAAIRVQESEGSQQDEVRTMWGVRACEGPGRSFCTAMGKPQEEPASPNSIQPPAVALRLTPGHAHVCARLCRCPLDSCQRPPCCKVPTTINPSLFWSWRLHHLRPSLVTELVPVLTVTQIRGPS